MRFITVTAERALEQAKIAEAEIGNGSRRGPLHGIPVGLKDFFDTAGVRTTGAFEHFRNRVPVKDAPVVTQIKEAGAIIVGKTNMHTLGMGTTSVERCIPAPQVGLEPTSLQTAGFRTVPRPYAKISFTTLPYTSVKRKSRPA